MKIYTRSYRDGAWDAPIPPISRDATRRMLLVFGASSYATSPEPLRALQAAHPDAILLGCSTSGEILGEDVEDETLAAAVIDFARTELSLARAHIATPSGSYDAGRTLAADLARADLRGVHVLSDGLNVNGSELVRGLNDTLGDHVIVTGGLAGDGADFNQTWVLAGDELGAGLIAAVGFYGEHVQISHGSQGGWDTFGPTRRVTRSEGNVLFELDDQPALELYKRYLGDRASGLPATGLLFPLAVRQHEGADKVLVRTILAVDEENQSLTFAGDIPQGSYAQLMKANYERLIDGAQQAAEAAAPPQAASDTLLISISCVGRRLVLGERSEEEIEVVLDAMPARTHQLGFYSYGELSPFTSGPGPCDLHNQTMTVTTIRED